MSASLAALISGLTLRTKPAAECIQPPSVLVPWDLPFPLRDLEKTVSPVFVYCPALILSGLRVQGASIAPRSHISSVYATPHTHRSSPWLPVLANLLLSATLFLRVWPAPHLPLPSPVLAGFPVNMARTQEDRPSTGRHT
ncbi:hypothetical protein FB451DRAFT_1531553 [Mycena latifolia]|nr:hypothetical protein FB451DRAFT_1531553 [Mycena latifolia]